MSISCGVWQVVKDAFIVVEQTKSPKMPTEARIQLEEVYTVRFVT